MYKILLWNLVIKAIVCKIHRTSDLLKHQWNSDEGELTEINKRQTTKLFSADTIQWTTVVKRLYCMISTGK